MNQSFLHTSDDDLTEIQILTIDLNMPHPSFPSALAPVAPTFRQAPPLAAEEPTST